MRRLLVGIAAFAFSSLALSHYYFTRAITNPTTQTSTSSSPATLGTPAVTTLWRCVTAAGAVVGTPNANQATVEAACGTAVAGDGVTRYLEEVKTTVTPTTSTQTKTEVTRRIEVLGGTTIRVSDAHAGLIGINGAPSGGSQAPPASGESAHAPSWSITNQSLVTSLAYSLDLTTVASDLDSNALSFAVLSGTFPAGVSLVGSTISGTPSETGAFPMVLSVSDGTTTVAEPLVTTAATFDNVTVSPAQAYQLTIQYVVTPAAGDLDLVTGMAPSPAGAWNQIACIIRLNDSGNFDVFNGATAGYASDSTVGYSMGVEYTLKMVIDIASQTYDAFVGATQIADDYQFRLPAVSLGYFVSQESNTIGSTIENIEVVQPIYAPVTFTVGSVESLLTLSSPVVSEGDSGTATLQFQLSRAADGYADITFDYDTEDGTATLADSDYDSLSGSDTISAGETINLNVTVNGDTNEESNETVVMRISGITF